MRVPGRLRAVRILKDEAISSDERELFLQLHRLHVVNEYEDGRKSSVYTYDTVLRPALDAVVIALTGRVDGVWSICLRSSIRPPLLLRAGLELPVEETKDLFSLWELPAGLLELEDKEEGGIRERAAKETQEETGYVVDPSCFELWPQRGFPTSGVIPERMFFLSAVIEDIEQRQQSCGDGTPAEDGCELWWVSMSEALEMCDRGELPDMKTELGIRRLAARGEPSDS